MRRAVRSAARKEPQQTVLGRVQADVRAELYRVPLRPVCIITLASSLRLIRSRSQNAPSGIQLAMAQRVRSHAWCRQPGDSGTRPGPPRPVRAYATGATTLPSCDRSNSRPRIHRMLACSSAVAETVHRAGLAQCLNHADGQSVIAPTSGWQPTDSALAYRQS
jgi:hypothetical protein